MVKSRLALRGRTPDPATAPTPDARGEGHGRVIRDERCERFEPSLSDGSRSATENGHRVQHCCSVAQSDSGGARTLYFGYLCRAWVFTRACDAPLP